MTKDKISKGVHQELVIAKKAQLFKQNIYDVTRQDKISESVHQELERKPNSFKKWQLRMYHKEISKEKL